MMDGDPAPRAGLCEHTSSGRSCPISKSPCPGECVYANILEEIQLGIIGVDTRRKQIFFENKLAVELFGRTIAPRDYGALTSLLLADDLRTSPTSAARKRSKMRYGTRFIGWTVYRISDSCFWIFASDITEQERLSAVAEAITTMNNLGYMLAGIRHELGNPINSIKTAVTVLRDNVERYAQDVVAEFLDRILADVSRVELLLRDLRNFSMYEGPELQDVDLRSFLDRLLSIIGADLSRRGIRMRISVHPDAEQGRFDPRALQHVMVNILTNAIDAMGHRRTPRIAIAVKRSGGRIALTIQDNGCGIPEDFKHHLFKPFFTTKKDGTGLGLVIMKNMMAKMDGTIDIESSEGVGTTVTLDLPAAGSPELPAGRPRTAQHDAPAPRHARSEAT